MEGGVLGLDEDLGVEAREVAEHLLEDWVGRVGLIVDAEANRDAVAGIILSEGRGDAVVEVRLEALDWTDDGHEGSIMPKL